jgi:hypothetical protein
LPQITENTRIIPASRAERLPRAQHVASRSRVIDTSQSHGENVFGNTREGKIPKRSSSGEIASPKMRLKIRTAAMRPPCGFIISSYFLYFLTEREREREREREQKRACAVSRYRRIIVSLKKLRMPAFRNADKIPPIMKAAERQL